MLLQCFLLNITASHILKHIQVCVATFERKASFAIKRMGGELIFKGIVIIRDYSEIERLHLGYGSLRPRTLIL